MLIRAFRSEDRQAVVDLWQRCGLIRPWNDPHRDIDRKLAEKPELFLVGEIDSRVVASAMVGYDGHRGWINYLAIDRGHQRGGCGTALVGAAIERLKDLGCPKLNVQIRRGNDAAERFYRQLGFVEDEAISMGLRLETDDERARE